MITKRHNLKVFNIIAVFVLAAMLLNACAGFTFQAQAQPDGGGGVGLNGGVNPVQPIQPGVDTTGVVPVTGEQMMMNPLTIVLLLVGFAFLVLILLLLVRRPAADAK